MSGAGAQDLRNGCPGSPEQVSRISETASGLRADRPADAGEERSPATPTARVQSFLRAVLYMAEEPQCRGSDALGASRRGGAVRGLAGSAGRYTETAPLPAGTTRAPRGKRSPRRMRGLSRRCRRQEWPVRPPEAMRRCGNHSWSGCCVGPTPMSGKARTDCGHRVPLVRYRFRPRPRPRAERPGPAGDHAQVTLPKGPDAPTGQRNEAQGCGVHAATLGLDVHPSSPTPKGLRRQTTAVGGFRNPPGVDRRRCSIVQGSPATVSRDNPSLQCVTPCMFRLRIPRGVWDQRPAMLVSSASTSR
jgi:hypothetical protein